MHLDWFVSFVIFSMSLRWLVFKYKKFRWLVNWLKSSKHSLLAELSQCCYCQTIEASIVVFLVLRIDGVSITPITGLLYSLSSGFIAIILDSLIEDSIKRMEESHSFSLQETDVGSSSVMGFLQNTKSPQS